MRTAKAAVNVVTPSTNDSCTFPILDLFPILNFLKMQHDFARGLEAAGEYLDGWKETGPNQI